MSETRLNANHETIIAKHTLSKQQEAVLARALSNGGTCRSTTANAALVHLGESHKDSALITGDVLQSLVELGLMVKSGPGKYDLTHEGSRLAAQNHAKKSP